MYLNNKNFPFDLNKGTFLINWFWLVKCIGWNKQIYYNYLLNTMWEEVSNNHQFTLCKYSLIDHLLHASLSKWLNIILCYNILCILYYVPIINMVQKFLYILTSTEIINNYYCCFFGLQLDLPNVNYSNCDLIVKVFKSHVLIGFYNLDVIKIILIITDSKNWG